MPDEFKKETDAEDANKVVPWDASGETGAGPATLTPEEQEAVDDAAIEAIELTLEGRRDELATALEAVPNSDIPELLESFQAAEIAEVLEETKLETQLRVLRSLPTDDGVEIFDHLEADDKASIVTKFREPRARQYLEEISPDERADLFAELPAEVFDRLIALLPREDRLDVRNLLRHDESTAGGLMTSDFAFVSPDMTVAETLQKLREDFNDIELIYYVYVLDAAEKLVGLLTLRFLLFADPNALVADVMHGNVISLPVDTDQEIVAQELALYDFLALPIVDRDKRMIGIVTFDDVVDVLEEEAAEDQDLFGGMSPSQDDYTDQTIWQGVKQRLPWLALFMVLSSGSTFVLENYTRRFVFTGDGSGSMSLSAAFFAGVIALLPMVMAMAGNAATQTATLVIRALNIRDIRGKNIGRVLAKELILGLIMGVGLALLGFARAWFTADVAPAQLGLAVAGSLVLLLAVSTVIGAALPILFQAIRLDPAVMSSPFIATFIDIVTVFLYFNVAIFVQQIALS